MGMSVPHCFTVNEIVRFLKKPHEDHKRESERVMDDYLEDFHSYHWPLFHDLANIEAGCASNSLTVRGRSLDEVRQMEEANEYDIEEREGFRIRRRRVDPWTDFERAVLRNDREVIERAHADMFSWHLSGQPRQIPAEAANKPLVIDLDDVERYPALVKIPEEAGA